MINNLFKFLCTTVFLSLILECLMFDLPIFLDGRLLIIIMSLFLFILRLNKIKLINHKFRGFLTVLSLMTITLTLALMLAENFYGFQFVETNLRISYSRVFYLSLALTVLAIYAQSFYLSKKMIKNAIFYLPVFLVSTALFVFLRNQQFFRLLIKDDQFVEYSQFFLLTIASLIALFLGKFWRPKEPFLGFTFFFLALGFFFVAGEEISWGQRIFMIDTPEKLAERNLQGELTLHNIDIFFGLVYRAYMIIGLVGSSAWLLYKSVKNHLPGKTNRILSNLIPDWYLSPYFAVAFFYNYERFYINPRVGEELWEEPMELLLIIGITIFMIVKYFRAHPKRKII